MTFVRKRLCRRRETSLLGSFATAVGYRGAGATEPLPTTNGSYDGSEFR